MPQWVSPQALHVGGWGVDTVIRVSISITLACDCGEQARLLILVCLFQI